MSQFGLSYARRVLNQEDAPLMFNVARPSIKRKRSNSKRGVNKRTRLHIMQKGQCHYCWRIVDFSSWSIDHRVPLCCGGSNRVENLIGACKQCNKKKGSLSEEEFTSSEYIKSARAKIC